MGEEGERLKAEEKKKHQLKGEIRLKNEWKVRGKGGGGRVEGQKVTFLYS